MKKKLSYWLFLTANIALGLLWIVESRSAYEIGGYLGFIGVVQMLLSVVGIFYPERWMVLALTGMQVMSQMFYLFISTALGGGRALILSAVCLVWDWSLLGLNGQETIRCSNKIILLLFRRNHLWVSL